MFSEAEKIPVIIFSEPTYWLRRSGGQYGKENNQASIFEAKGVLSQEDWLAHHCPYRKAWNESFVSVRS